MKHKKRVTEGVMQEAQQRNEEIKEQLKSNENYRQISHLEDRLSDLIEETKESTNILDQFQKVFLIMTFLPLYLLVLLTIQCFSSFT